MAALGVVASSSASLLRPAAPLDCGAAASSSSPSSPSFSPSFSSSAAQLNGNLANLKSKQRSAPFDLRPSALPRIAAPLDFVASSSPASSSFSSSAAQLSGNVANFKCKQRIAPLDKRPQAFSNFLASSSSSSSFPTYSFLSAGTELSGNVADFKCKQRRAPLDKRPQAFSNFLASSFFSASSPSCSFPSSSFSVSSPSSSFSVSSPSPSSSFPSSSFSASSPSFFSGQWSGNVAKGKSKRRNAALERGAAAQLSGNAEARGVAGRKWQQNAVLAEESVRERAEDAEEGTSTSQEVIDAEAQLFVQTYARAPLVFVAGQGCWLTDAEGKKYLDMTAGIAVNALGHGDTAWVRAVTEQAATLTHVSNLYHTVPQVKLAERLVNSSFADRVFFANSGTEANEAAIKFSRKYQRTVHGSETEKTELIAFNNGFHGRTLGALALTSKVQYRAPFEPLMPGVTFIEFGDLEVVAQVVKGSGNVAAIFVEPVQGEGGVYPAVESFLKGLRNLCDETGTLLVFDEIQCGLARTGTLWAHEPYGVEPDLMTLAKPLAGGLPIGAVLVTNAVASAVAYGDHGSTFAGGPLVCTAALAVMDRLQEPGFLQSVEAKGQYLVKRLTEELIGKNQHVKEIRGAGLLVGIQLDVSANPVVLAAREEGMILITAGKGDVIRLAPPLVIAEKELDHAVNILVKCLDGL